MTLVYCNGPDSYDNLNIDDVMDEFADAERDVWIASDSSTVRIKLRHWCADQGTLLLDVGQQSDGLAYSPPKKRRRHEHTGCMSRAELVVAHALTVQPSTIIVFGSDASDTHEIDDAISLMKSVSLLRSLRRVVLIHPGDSAASPRPAVAIPVA